MPTRHAEQQGNVANVRPIEPVGAGRINPAKTCELLRFFPVKLRQRLGPSRAANPPLRARLQGLKPRRPIPQHVRY
jgi:hypothetical protein